MAYELSLEVDPTHEEPPALALTIYQQGGLRNAIIQASCALHGEAMRWLYHHTNKHDVVEEEGYAKNSVRSYESNQDRSISTQVDHAHR